MLKIIMPLVLGLIVLIIIIIIVSRDFKDMDIKCPQCSGGKVITIFGGTWECLDCHYSFMEQEGIYKAKEKQ